MRGQAHDPEAEAAVIAAILLRGEPAYFEAADQLQPGDFFLPQNRALYEAFAALVERGVPIDPASVEAQLQAVNKARLVGGIGAVSAITDKYASARNLEHHAATIQRLAVVRSLAAVARDVAQEAAEPLEDAAQWIDRAEQRLLDAAERGRRSRAKAAPELLRKVFTDITARAKRRNPITGVETHFVDLDKMTGGLQPGDLVIIAARPSMGKTAFVLNLAQNASVPRERDLLAPVQAVRQPVLFFSLEMGAQALMERLLCAEAKVDYSKLRSGQLLEDDLRALISAAERIAQSQLWIDDEAAPSILEMRARARRFRENRKVFCGAADEHGLVVVDYLQLARGSKDRYQSREQEISDISRGLKAMAKELRMPVLALSQLNRAVDSRPDHRPQLSDLRESGAIEQDADVILFLYREERYLQADATLEQRRAVEGKAELIIGKQRNGPIGTVHLTFIQKHTQFVNARREL